MINFYGYINWQITWALSKGNKGDATLAVQFIDGAI